MEQRIIDHLRLALSFAQSGESLYAALQLEEAARLCRFMGDLKCALDYEQLARRGRGDDDLDGRTCPRIPPPPQLTGAMGYLLPSNPFTPR